ncbi:helix-turn-helix transcriptional regulator [Bradyrhizobium manausense]|uniref:LuxR C-terminal-related transcriptional regulator n=1 Tax=Bradyrhizobium TaxID=374 RepID=UPI001BAD628B|nr:MULTISPECIES: helix-turn-helix transcriptional regulator [Bradyrhizobium]MBR0825684.1 helix-turn-helix transcriptional regulator [Bradyrhizobium manausense]UVO31366.1 helix-turn-helix transcriptional regulator [Bradyrhizobium arachidis]
MTVCSDPETVQQSWEHRRARDRAGDQVDYEIARQLNGPLIALLLYMNEIKRHSRQMSPVVGDPAYLQQVVENALHQTERIWAIVKQAATRGASAPEIGPEDDGAGADKEGDRGADIMAPSGSSQMFLTKREREVLSLVSNGYSNKQGARQLSISPRTFESHRAGLIRKLGARNTADLVRLALLHHAV